MRRFSLSQQLMLIFFAILLVSCTLFSLLFSTRLESIYKAETFNRLQAVINFTRSDWSKGEKINLESDSDVEFAFIQGRIGNTIAEMNIEKSPNISSYVSGNDLIKIIEKLNYGSKGQDAIHGERVYFFAYEVDMSGHFIIMITDTTYITNLRDTISFQVIIIFLTVLTFAALLIGIWSKCFVNRINKIQTHVRNMPQQMYEVEYNDGGYDEVGELSLNIEEMRKEIKDNDETKREMLQNLSHDFKTPIAVIKSYAEAIEDGMAGPEVSGVILSQVDNLKRKVNKLLQYNRLEYLTKDAEFQKINMKDLILNVVSTYSFQTEIKIETDLEEVYYLGYSENFYTIIDNILDNAKRYAKSVIRINLTHDELTIYNDGPHIDEQFLNGLFKPYEKGSNGQFGLGMSIVKKTLDFFTMDLEVENLEVGVCFKIKKRI